MKTIAHGDFTELAGEYANRPGYSLLALRIIGSHIGSSRPGFNFADVGAGTGKLTECLLALGLNGVAVEPNDAMRTEGRRAVTGVEWLKGSAETTGLPGHSVDWVLMGSSFHWTNPEQSLPEFRRILRKGGALTLVWNPRAIEASERERRIEERIREIVPELKRVSSGARAYTETLESTLVKSGLFAEVFHLDVPHEQIFSPERYLGAWRSVNDIRVQAGPERWPKILDMITEEIRGQSMIAIPYRTRAWTALSI